MGTTSKSLITSTHLNECQAENLTIIYLLRQTPTLGDLRPSEPPPNVPPSMLRGSSWWVRRFRAFLGRLQENHLQALYDCRRARLAGRPPGPECFRFLLYVASLNDDWLDDDELRLVRWARRSMLKPIVKAIPRAREVTHGLG